MPVCFLVKTERGWIQMGKRNWEESGVFLGRELAKGQRTRLLYIIWASGFGVWSPVLTGKQNKTKISLANYGGACFNPRTQEVQADLSEVQASLVYIASSRPARGTQWDPTSKINNETVWRAWDGTECSSTTRLLWTGFHFSPAPPPTTTKQHFWMLKSVFERLQNCCSS